MAESIKDTIVIGAGPAGLAAASACIDRGQSCLVIDHGPVLSKRDRNDPKSLTRGVGGAGLYSDGKFSFYPSATELWLLNEKNALSLAYSWFSELISSYGLKVPKFPADPSQKKTPSQGCFQEKKYQSEYMSLESRLALTSALAARIGKTLLTNHSISDCRLHAGKWLCTVTDGETESLVESRAIVYAGGRFGPLDFRRIFRDAPTAFRHVEIGVRLEQPVGNFFLAKNQQRDPKLQFDGVADGMGLRTFCCCREGEVIATCTSGLWSVSGRADGPATGFSNVGFNLRITNQELAHKIWSAILPRMKEGLSAIVREQLSVFLAAVQNPNLNSEVVKLFGGQTSEVIASGIRHLTNLFPSLSDADTAIWAPTIEGVGDYPLLDADLRSAPKPLWVAGDSSGIFRGLTAAMVSGYYTGIRASQLGGQ